MIDGSSRQTATSSAMRNMTIALAYRGPWLPVDHEISHALVGMTGLTSVQRIEGSPADTPWFNEHMQVIFPLDDKVYNLEGTGFKSMLRPVKYTGYVLPKPVPIPPGPPQKGPSQKGGVPG